MFTIHSSYKDSRFNRLSFVAPAAAAGAAAAGSSLTPALISAGGSILAGGLGALASGLSSSKYLKGVRETNAANLQLAREQRDWDLAQWNRENEYNSASAQLARWQAAGFSPQSFTGVGSPGDAAALESPDMANQQAPGDLSGYASSFAQSIQNGVQGATKSALDWRQMELNQKQLDLEKARLANQTRETESHVSLNDALTKESQKRLDYIEAQTRMTEEQRWKFRAEADIAFQTWLQREKIFPLEYHSKELDNAIRNIDKILNEETLQDRIRAYSIQNNKTIAETKSLLQQAVYWMYQGKEGEFQVSLQPLRFDMLNWQQQQAHFDLNFAKNTRYSQLSFENTMKGLHAFAELGHLAVDVAGELRAWVHPSSYTWNYNFLNQSGSKTK